MKPLISVVIPTYNRAHDIERALKSVRAQSYTNWEALVVDNHSSDDTDDVVNGFNDPRIRLFKIHNNGVIGVSRNWGLKHALGEYIAFLDSDDWWQPQKLEESLNYIAQGADIVYHDLFLATKSNQKIFWRKIRSRGLNSPVYDDLIANGSALNNSSVVARRSILQAIGGMSEDINLVSIEDYDTWVRAAKITENFKRVPRTLGYWWVGGGNISSPARLIKGLGAFEELYAKDIDRLSKDAGLWWLNFDKGQAYYSLGSYAMAMSQFKRANWRHMRLRSMASALWMILMMKLRHRV